MVATKVRRIRGTLPACALLICALVFAGGALELLTRLAFHSSGRQIENYRPRLSRTGRTGDLAFDLRRFISHPFLPYLSRPFDSRTLYVFRRDIKQVVSYEYLNNSLGFRSPERPFVKQARTKRILTLGGSTTWDGPTNDLTWPTLLERKLQAEYSQTSYTIEVMNLGVDAGTSPMSFTILSFLGTEFSPDLVISYDGVNDNAFIGYQGITPDYRSAIRHFDDQKRPLAARLPAWTMWSYVVSLGARGLDRLLGFGFMDVWDAAYTVRKLPHGPDEMAGIEYFQRNLRLMRGVAKEYGAGFLGATAHWVSPSSIQRRQNDAMRRFFADSGIEFVDLDSLLPHQDWSIHVDQVHWTPKGLDLVAESFKRAICSRDMLGLEQRR